MANGSGLPKTDAEWLYDCLDRLVHSVVEENGKMPEHCWSPVGSALALLHEKKAYATERAWCIDNTGSPPQ